MHLPLPRSVLVAIPEVDSEASVSPRPALPSECPSDDDEENLGRSKLRDKCWLVLRIELVSALLASLVTAGVSLRKDVTTAEEARRRLALAQSSPTRSIRFSNPYEAENDSLDFARLSPVTSCSNLESILLKSGTYLSVNACGEACGNTPGCHSFDYQQAFCDGDSGEAGECHLLAGECRRQRKSTSICGASVQRMERPAQETWRKNASGYGCSNWERMMICTADVGLTVAACGVKCAETPGCTGFNHQPNTCSGTEMAFKGACILFSGECEKLENPCWDLYSMLPASAVRRPGGSEPRLRGGGRSEQVEEPPPGAERRWHVEPLPELAQPPAAQLV